MIRLSKYGAFIISSGEIPGGSDASKLFPVFTSGSSCTEIQFVQHYGGDADEFAQLILVPPTIPINGTTGPADHPGCIAITPVAYMTGAIYSVNTPDALGGTSADRAGPRFQPFTVPPFYQVALMQETANTTAWVVTVGGFEIA